MLKYCPSPFLFYSPCTKANQVNPSLLPSYVLRLCPPIINPDRQFSSREIASLYRIKIILQDVGGHISVKFPVLSLSKVCLLLSLLILVLRTIYTSSLDLLLAAFFSPACLQYVLWVKFSKRFSVFPHYLAWKFHLPLAQFIFMLKEVCFR